MADRDEDGGRADIDLSLIVEGLRRTGLSEAESWAVVNDREAWRDFANGMAEAKAALDRMMAGIPGPTHPGTGRA